MKFGLSPKMRERTESNILVIAAAIGMILILFRFRAILGGISEILSVFFPFILGCVIAFILTPVVNRLDTLMYPVICRRMRRPKLLRFFSILLSYILLITIIASFFAILVPQLVASLRSLTTTVTDYVTNHRDELNDVIQQIGVLLGNEELSLSLESLANEAITQVLTYSNVLVGNIMSLTLSISSFIAHLFIALIAGFYLLFEKEHFAVQCKKVMYAFMEKKTVKLLLHWLRTSQKMFSGFITGKLIDSLIIGALCYVAMLVLRLDYAMLISVIIGFTNILPFFGPFIGAIPSILILLIIHPWQAFTFAIMVLILQQIDGNIIGPHVLGDSLGLSPFWIMVSIVVGSAMFGFAGMVLGAPVFAVGYAIFKTYVNYRLESRNLPTDTRRYVQDDVADVPESEHIFKEQ